MSDSSAGFRNDCGRPGKVLEVLLHVGEEWADVISAIPVNVTSFVLTSC